MRSNTLASSSVGRPASYSFYLNGSFLEDAEREVVTASLSRKTGYYVKARGGSFVPYSTNLWGLKTWLEKVEDGSFRVPKGWNMPEELCTRESLLTLGNILSQFMHPQQRFRLKNAFYGFAKIVDGIYKFVENHDVERDWLCPRFNEWLVDRSKTIHNGLGELVIPHLGTSKYLPCGLGLHDVSPAYIGYFRDAQLREREYALSKLFSTYGHKYDVVMHDGEGTGYRFHALMFEKDVYHDLGFGIDDTSLYPVYLVEMLHLVVRYIAMCRSEKRMIRTPPGLCNRRDVWNMIQAIKDTDIRIRSCQLWYEISRFYVHPDIHEERGLCLQSYAKVDDIYSGTDRFYDALKRQVWLRSLQFRDRRFHWTYRVVRNSLAEGFPLPTVVRYEQDFWPIRYCQLSFCEAQENDVRMNLNTFRLDTATFSKRYNVVKCAVAFEVPVNIKVNDIVMVGHPSTSVGITKSEDSVNAAAVLCAMQDIESGNPPFDTVTPFEGSVFRSSRSLLLQSTMETYPISTEDDSVLYEQPDDEDDESHYAQVLDSFSNTSISVGPMDNDDDDNDVVDKPTCEQLLIDFNDQRSWIDIDEEEQARTNHWKK
jgi:hypothetical protein